MLNHVCPYQRGLLTVTALRKLVDIQVKRLTNKICCFYSINQRRNKSLKTNSRYILICTQYN